MSYLDPVTIIFSGDFKSDVSTVNNDVRHYDNETFEKRFQHEVPRKPGSTEPEIQDGWWNPNGGATFSFLNCKVTRCILPGGIESNDERLIGSMVTDPNDRPPGKMVDLDPQMQFTSELWGVGCRLVSPGGTLLFSGELETTGFRDAQKRQFPLSESDKNFMINGQPLGGNWITTIKNIVWGNIEDIGPVKLLKDLTQGNRLSLSLSAFGYFYTHLLGRFSLGKIIGAIGPWKQKDPVRFAPGRRLYGTVIDVLQYLNFIINDDLLTIDFGMAFPIQDPLGTPHKNFTSFTVAVAKRRLDIPLSSKTPVVPNPADYEIIGNIAFPADNDWLLTTGGIVQIKIPAAAQQLVSNNQILLLRPLKGELVMYAREGADGWYIRCDQNVLRIDPGETMENLFFVYQWGKPIENVSVNIQLQPKQSGGGGGPQNDPAPPAAAIPDINFPAGAITVNSDFKTDRSGICAVRFTGADPGNPRKYIDGQMYLFDYSISGNMDTEKYFNDTVMLHLRDAFDVPEKPDWEDVKEIFAQFGNLYPVMSKHVVDMHVAKDIIAKKDLLIFAFSQDINSPFYMPVTRDLSASKIETIVKWLKNPLVDNAKAKKKKKPAAMQAAGPEPGKKESLLSLASRAKAGDMTALNILFNKTPLDLL